MKPTTKSEIEDVRIEAIEDLEGAEAAYWKAWRANNEAQREMMRRYEIVGARERRLAELDSSCSTT